MHNQDSIRPTSKNHFENLTSNPEYHSFGWLAKQGRTTSTHT
jgi:hypothetical protein